MMWNRLPVAWMQLFHQKTRFVIALSGVIFAVVIVFMQLGIRDALFDSAVRLHKGLNGEIFLISPRSTALIAMDHFSERRLAQLLAFPDVEYTVPIYTGFNQWKNPDTRDYWRNIFVIGYDTTYDAFTYPGSEQRDVINYPDAVLFDRDSRAEFGPIVSWYESREKITTELGDSGFNRQVKVVGLFQLGTSFGADGNLLTSDLNFLRINSNRAKGLINIGLVKLKPGSDVEQNIAQFKAHLPTDVVVLSKDEFIAFEKNYWESSTAIGFVFALGVVLGLVVAVVVVYQILYTNVSEHLPEYATLKAIGYKNRYLLQMILQQAVIIAILGYIPGFLITIIQYDITQKATLLPVSMSWERGIFVLIATVAMCIIAGWTAVRKLKDADPADIF